MNETGTVSKDEAIEYIIGKARSEGLSTWKTFYKGDMIATPNDLPDNVELSDVRISAIHDQA